MRKRLPRLTHLPIIMAVVISAVLGLMGTANAASTQLSPARIQGELQGVAATSSTNAWAVGYRLKNGADLNLAMHWNGKVWSSVPAPLPPAPPGASTNHGGLVAVAAASSTSAWAIGTSNYGLDERHCTPDCTQILYWNGKSWKQVPVPVIGNPAHPDRVILDGLAAISSTSAWAVGGLAGNQTLILHWNGKSWRRVPSPSISTTGSESLSAVTVVTAENAWAVGSDYVGPGTDLTLILHWNGRSWSKAKLPASLDSPAADLNSLAASWAGSVWAVGRIQGALNSALIEHWNGKSWRQVPSPAGPFGQLGLVAVAAARGAGAWALNNGQQIQHWNGKTWALVPTPSAGGLEGVATTSARNAWVVGYAYHASTSSYTPVILRWDGTSWSTCFTG